MADAADDSVSRRLRNWGLPHLIPVFLEKSVTEAAFKRLNEGHISHLLKGFGDQVVFEYHYKQFLNGVEIWVLPVDTNLNEDASSSHISHSPLSHISAIAPGSSAASCSSSVPSVSSVASCSSSVPSVSSRASSPSISSTPSYCLCYQWGLARQQWMFSYGCNVLQLKRRLREREIRKVCDIIVNEFLKDKPDEKILPSQLENWAEKFFLVFPLTPKALFYSTRINNRAYTLNSSGSLRSAYYGYRREIKLMRDEFVDENDDDDFDDQDELPAANDVKEAIEWLTDHFEPMDQVLEKWAKTHGYRKLLLNTTLKDLSSYLDKFKILRQPFGYLLVQSDFAVSYPESVAALASKLDDFVTLVFDRLKKVRPCPRFLKAVINQEEANVMTGGKLNSIRILLSLSYLLPTVTVSKKKVGKITAEIPGWRSTKHEVQNGFITLIDDVSKLQETVSRRDLRFASLNLTRQLFVIWVGNESQIATSYVSVNDFLYQFSEPLDS
ncbi:hypothetical protein ONE63_003517 [Megalurothrips usitatus]|uniref:Uncharacterized protein n=1 Tax=Megalurothrips usitatus TaxID=439358 RepID=A0AAV7X6R4_9NEOP|nr:hypothetical protein ONE63_003517 [Megalurothrips usitatus]